jgi:dephospho-CoA kinase
VPFPDELARGLAVVAYDRRWPGDFAVLARKIHGALGPMAVRVNHVGSTSVPGLAAKDCVDVQVEVPALAEELIAGCFEKIGFRLRPEPWNHMEVTPGGLCPKLVFAPSEGERASNIHVLEAASEAARRKLLFRDYLRAHDTARDAWSDFKQRLAAMATDIYQYGQAKAGPTEILLIAAESWARETQWAPPWSSRSSQTR